MLFSVGNLRKACEAVASYLLFYPDDETMLSNMRYYSSLPKVQDTFFEPREVRSPRKLVSRNLFFFLFRKLFVTFKGKYMKQEFWNTSTKSSSPNWPSKIRTRYFVNTFLGTYKNQNVWLFSVTITLLNNF